MAIAIIIIIFIAIIKDEPFIKLLQFPIIYIHGPYFINDLHKQVKLVRVIMFKVMVKVMVMAKVLARVMVESQYLLYLLFFYADF